MSDPAVVLAPEVMRAINGEARRGLQTLKKFGMDLDDVRQEFVAHLLVCLERYDPTRASLSTFATHCCRHRKLQIIEHSITAKRNFGRLPESLSMPTGADDSTPSEFGDLLSDDEVAVRTGRRSRPAAEVMNLRIDLKTTLRSLPADLAVVASRLEQDESRVKVASLLGISRASLLRRIVRLGSAFRAAGLDSYMAIKEAA